MVASGILPLDDGCIPVAGSGDTRRWQGGDSYTMYNLQSGHTMLCGAWNKKVLVYKFSKLCQTCNEHKKH